MLVLLVPKGITTFPCKLCPVASEMCQKDMENCQNHQNHHHVHIGDDPPWASKIIHIWTYPDIMISMSDRDAFDHSDFVVVACVPIVI